MALFFSPPTSLSASIPSGFFFYWKPGSRLPSCLPSSKPSGASPSRLFSEQIPLVRCRCPLKAPNFASSPLSPSLGCIKAPTSSLALAATGATGSGYFISDTTGGLGLDGEEDEEGGEGSPWEGAVVYRRDASVTHLEYCTTLERLGLGKLSTELSRSRASAMGIRLVRTRKGGAAGETSSSGTPVLVSIDVTRKKRKLKIDGILRTVITLGCNRCAELAAECVFSNFALLLTEDPIEEPEEIDMGVMYGEDEPRSAASAGDAQEDEDDRLIGLDDRLYFPAEEKEIDISKHIRDMVHVEITINAVCDASCKGLCLKCGTNLNRSGCSCHKGGEDAGERRRQYGPLGTLKKQMQQR